MQCPRCAYVSQSRNISCPSCHGTFARTDLEELDHLTFTRDRLDRWTMDGTLAAQVGARLVALTDAERNRLLAHIDLQAAPKVPRSGQVAAGPAPAARVQCEDTVIAAKAADRCAAPALAGPGSSAAASRAGPPAPRHDPSSGGAPLPPPSRSNSARRLSPGLAVPALAPARKQVPSFTWKQVGTYLLSERTLNALLGMGAFLILAAAVVISTVNPTGLGPLTHLAAMLGTTAVFYAAGVAVQHRLGLPRTGAALLAIGAAFIPLDACTFGRDILALEPRSIWVVASLLCLPIYLTSHLTLYDRASAVLTSVAGGSLVMSLAYPLGVDPIWGGCALVGLAGIYLVVAQRIRHSRKNLYWSLFWGAQLATPICMAGLLALRFAPGVLGAFPPRAFLNAVGALPGASLDYAVGTTWWLGAAYYALAAHLMARRSCALAAAWIIPCAVLFTLTKSPLGAEWYGVALAALAALYMLFGRHVQDALNGAARPSLLQLIGRPAYQVGLTLALLAAMWPPAISQARLTSTGESIALWMLVGLSAWSALTFRHALFRYAAAYLILAALASAPAGQVPSVPGQPGLGLAALAACYLLFGRLTGGRHLRGDRRAAYAGLARDPFFQVAALLTAVAALRPALIPHTTFVAPAELLALAAVALVYGAAAFLLDQRAWAYICIALVPGICGTAMAWQGVGGDTALLGWAVLATVLCTGGEVAAWRTGEGRRPLARTLMGIGSWRSRFGSPLFAGGYLVSGLAASMGLSQRADLSAMPGRGVAGLCLVCALYVISSAARRSSVFLYPATWLLLLPLTAVVSHAYAQRGMDFSAAQDGRLLAILGIGYLALAFPVDRAGGHYAKPLYLAAYALATLGVAFAIPDRSLLVQSLGISLLGLIWSAGLVHAGHHPSHAWAMVQFVGDGSATALEAAEMLFQYLAIWLLPVWLVLLQSLRQPLPGVADYGLVLAALAPTYAALGLLFRRIHAAYRLPWYLAACVLSALGPLAALPDPGLRIAALAVSIALYVASAVKSHRHEWLWLAATLGPVLLLDCLLRTGDPAHSSGVALLALSLCYGAIGMIVRRRWFHGTATTPRAASDRFALPFFAVGQALCLIGLALAVMVLSADLAVLGFALAAVQYGCAAAISRRRVFATPLALTFAAAYWSGMLVCGLPIDAYGPALLPALAAFLIVAELFRLTVGAADVVAERRRRPYALTWALPFEVCAHFSAVSAFVLSAQGSSQATAWWGIAAVYCALAVSRRQPGWLYAGAGSALAAYAGTGMLLAPGLTLPVRLLSFVPAVYALGGLAEAIGWRTSREHGSEPWYLRRQESASVAWALPVLAWGAVAATASLVLSAGDALLQCSASDLYVAVAYFWLAAVLSLTWHSRALVWAAIVSCALGFEEALALAGVAWINQPACWAGAALSGTLAGTLCNRSDAKAAKLWGGPLLVVSYAASLPALVVAVANLSIGQQALPPLAVTLALAGSYFLAHGLAERRHLPCYAGIGLLDGAYACELLYRDVAQPQAFSLVLGLSLLLAAYLEWRRGATTSKALLELAAIGAVLGTTLVQGCGGLGAGDDRFSYDTFLLLESVVVFGLASALRWKRLFFAACGALVADTGILLVDPLRSMPAWYLMAAIGFAMIGLVVFLEQRRQQIPLWIDEVRLHLDTWG